MSPPLQLRGNVVKEAVDNLARKVVAVAAVVTLAMAAVAQELMVLAVGVDVATLTRAQYLMKNIRSPPEKRLLQKNLWPRG